MSLAEESEVDGPTQLHLVEPRPNPEHECSMKEAIALLDRAVTRLKPRYLEVIEMRHVQELSGIEVARILKMPVNTVKARLHRARGLVMRDVQKMLRLRRRRASANGTAA